MIREEPGVSRRIIALTAFGVILGGVTGLLASAERAAFTDSSSGAVSVASFHPSGTTFLGGLFVSQPALFGALDGSLTAVVRDQSNGLWVNSFSGQTQTWQGWVSGGGSFQGNGAAVTAKDGTSYFSFRDVSGGYWLMSYSGGSFTYRSLGGVFATDPRLALGPDGYIHVSGQDSGGAVWVATGRPADNPFPAFRSLAGVFQLGINAATDSNGMLYLAERDNFNSAWIGRWDRGVFFGWRFQAVLFGRNERRNIVLCVVGQWGRSMNLLVQ